MQKVVFICYADTCEPLRQRKQYPDEATPQVYLERDAVHLCNKRKWKARGRPLMITPEIIVLQQGKGRAYVERAASHI